MIKTYKIIIKSTLYVNNNNKYHLFITFFKTHKNQQQNGIQESHLGLERYYYQL